MHKHGRLGNPEETFMTDRRADPRFVQAMAAAAELQPPLPVPPPGSDYEARLAYCEAMETQMAEMNPFMEQAMPNYDHLRVSSETIVGAGTVRRAHAWRRYGPHDGPGSGVPSLAG